MSSNYNKVLRLNNILKAVQHASPATPSIHIWKQAFGIEQDSDFLVGFNQFIKLVNDVKKLKDSYTAEEQHIYFRDYSTIMNLTSLDYFQKSWQTVSGFIKGTTLQSFDTLLFELKKRDAIEPVVDAKQLQEWKKLLLDLETDIVVSSLDKNVKKVFLKCISLLTQAITYYTINGAEGIEDAMAACFGTFATNTETIKSSDSDKMFSTKFFDLANKINSVVAPLASIAKLIESGVELLS
jgi:hypothetical protein